MIVHNHDNVIVMVQYVIMIVNYMYTVCKCYWYGTSMCSDDIWHFGSGSNIFFNGIFVSLTFYLLCFMTFLFLKIHKGVVTHPLDP